jgi:hypothetical protein
VRCRYFRLEAVLSNCKTANRAAMCCQTTPFRCHCRSLRLKQAPQALLPPPWSAARRTFGIARRGGRHVGESRGLRVVAGYLACAHDSHVRSKLLSKGEMGQYAFGKEMHPSMCNDAAAASDWLQPAAYWQRGTKRTRAVTKPPTPRSFLIPVCCVLFSAPLLLRLSSLIPL